MSDPGSAVGVDEDGRLVAPAFGDGDVPPRICDPRPYRFGKSDHILIGFTLGHPAKRILVRTGENWVRTEAAPT